MNNLIQLITGRFKKPQMTNINTILRLKFHNMNLIVFASCQSQCGLHLIQTLNFQRSSVFINLEVIYFFKHSKLNPYFFFINNFKSLHTLIVNNVFNPLM